MSCRAITALACFLAVTGLGCGSDPNGANAGCGDHVTVGVGAGLEPSFIWLPNCAVHNLAVLEGIGPHPFGQYTPAWVVESQPDANNLPNNRLHSSIRYGQVPSEGRQVSAPVTLVGGQPYTVYLNVYTPDQRVETVGSRTFTP
jgi:hypothetical protein